jgi:TolA-binding protein
MNDHELRELLLRADADAWVTRSNRAAVDTAVIRNRERRRSLRNRAIVAAIAMIGCAATLVALQGRDASNGQAESFVAQTPRLSPEEIDALKSQIAVLDAEARSARSVVDRLRRAERFAMLESEIAAVEPISAQDSTPSEQIERAAGIGITSADFLAGELNRRQEAAKSYRAVVKHFPQSRWASVARQRLSQMDMMN